MDTYEQGEATMAWYENQGSKICSLRDIGKVGDNAYQLSLPPYMCIHQRNFEVKIGSQNKNVKQKSNL